MAGDPYRNALPGKPLAIPATAWNTLMTVAKREAGQTSTARGGGALSQRRSTFVTIHNNTGGDIDQFAVLGIGDVTISPTDNEEEFKRRVVLEGETPLTASHLGKFAVTLQAIPDDEYGTAVISGVVEVQVDVTDAAHTFADVKNSDTTQLSSTAASGAQILYKESGTGTKWAVIRIGGGAGGIEVKEVDGTPDVTGVSIIRFPNGTVTDDGGGQVSVATFTTWA